MTKETLTFRIPTGSVSSVCWCVELEIICSTFAHACQMSFAQPTFQRWDASSKKDRQCQQSLANGETTWDQSSCSWPQIIESCFVWSWCWARRVLFLSSETRWRSRRRTSRSTSGGRRAGASASPTCSSLPSSSCSGSPSPTSEDLWVSTVFFVLQAVATVRTSSHGALDVGVPQRVNRSITLVVLQVREQPRTTRYRLRFWNTRIRVNCFDARRKSFHQKTVWEISDFYISTRALRLSLSFRTKRGNFSLHFLQIVVQMRSVSVHPKPRINVC